MKNERIEIFYWTIQKFLNEEPVGHVMYRRILIILMLTTGCISQVYTEEDARNDALDFIRNAPTFSYDGVKKSLMVVDSEPAECEGCYVVTVQFTCRNRGFGDRASLFLIHQPTDHVAVIHLQEGEITRAIIDDLWDELNQKSITEQPS
jgi:hypothetical protein